MTASIRRVALVRPAGESSARDAVAYRALDLALAVPLTAVLSPVLALVVAAIRLDSPGPALIGKRRLGLDLEPFSLLAFRTRTRDGEPTRVGRVLERRGLDRLPRLFNVLRGEMSIVGPPPVAPKAVEHYPSHWFARFAVKPGLTGVAPTQALDYVSRRSLRLNLLILARAATRSR